jgi:hypothetical protein
LNTCQRLKEDLDPQIFHNEYNFYTLVQFPRTLFLRMHWNSLYLNFYSVVLTKCEHMLSAICLCGIKLHVLMFFLQKVVLK